MVFQLSVYLIQLPVFVCRSKKKQFSVIWVCWKYRWFVLVLCLVRCVQKNAGSTTSVWYKLKIISYAIFSFLYLNDYYFFVCILFSSQFVLHMRGKKRKKGTSRTFLLLSFCLSPSILFVLFIFAKIFAFHSNFCCFSLSHSLSFLSSSQSYSFSSDRHHFSYINISITFQFIYTFIYIYI